MTRIVPRIVLCLALCSLAASALAGGRRTSLPPEPAEVAARLVGAALTSPVAWERLIALCDDHGHRMTGSSALEEAYAWAHDQMICDGAANVRLEPVTVTVWERGEERVRLVAPRSLELHAIGLGGAPPTPEGGVEAEVVVADSFDHLAELGEAVSGRIVLFDVPFTTYGETAPYRTRGPRQAAALGAVAALVRSVGPRGGHTVHTGGTWFEDGGPRIPAAALSAEDASLLRRFAERGRTVRVRVELGGRFVGDGTSSNLVGEVVGRELPGEIVVVGCHFDSWDVGQGAQDDGAGCIMAMETVRLLAALPTPPRRTVRAVLFTNEELGLAGGRTYAETHRDELPRHVAAIEADTGAGQPLGFRVDVRREDEEEQAALAARALADLAPVSPLLAGVGAGHLQASWSGSDISPMVRAGVLGLGLDQDVEDYWKVHHAATDTVDHVDPELLRRNVAAMAVMAWWLAEREEPLVPPPTPPDDE